MMLSVIKINYLRYFILLLIAFLTSDDKVLRDVKINVPESLKITCLPV